MNILKGKREIDNTIDYLIHKSNTQNKGYLILVCRASLLNYVPYMPSCLTCLRALITRLAHLICYLRALVTRNIYSSQVVSVFSELIISLDRCVYYSYIYPHYHYYQLISIWLKK